MATPNPPTAQEFLWNDGFPAGVGSYPLIVGPAGDDYLVIRWLDAGPLDLWVGLVHIATDTATLVDSANLGTFYSSAQIQNAVNDTGSVGVVWRGGSAEARAAFITASGETLNVTSAALDGTPTWYDNNCAAISQDGAELVIANLATGGWKAFAYSTTDLSLSWSQAWTDPDTTAYWRGPLLGSPRAGRILLGSWPSSGDGTVFLADSSAIQDSIATANHQYDYGNNASWFGCGTDRSVYVVFEYDGSAPTPAYRLLDTAGDVLSWVQAEATLTPTDWDTWGGHIASAWDGQVAVLPGGMAECTATAYWVNPAEADSVASASVTIPADQYYIAACGWWVTATAYQTLSAYAGTEPPPPAVGGRARQLRQRQRFI